MKQFPEFRSYTKMLLVPVLMLVCVSNSIAQVLFSGPQPGDIYREYSWSSSQSNDYRVTDPNASHPGALQFLPNPVLNMTIGDLAGAVRAEALITLWGGHVGTTGKQIRFNGNPLRNIPELGGANGIPPGLPGQCYLHQVNAVIDVPLSDLVQGSNTFEGRNVGQTPCGDFGWGQHGWYGVTVRIYYNSSKPHATGSITSPVSGSTFDENPQIAVSATGGANRVDVLAYYDGDDTDGDGIYQEYHHDYHIDQGEVGMNIRHHVGSDGSAPYQMTWNTALVPDQAPGSVKLIARIRDGNDIWFVTDEVTNLTFSRTSSSVVLYKPFNVPDRFWVREGEGEKSSQVSITSLSGATSATLLVRTWNGIDGAAEQGQTHYTRVNGGWDAPDYGRNHYYSYDELPVPISALVAGTNTIAFNSTSSHHGIEVLWPGAAVIVRYGQASQLPAPGLVSPANNATDQPASLTLEWNSVPAATSYRVQVSTDPSFTTTVVDDQNVTGTSLQVGPLANGTTHHWRVQAKNATMTSPYSSVWSFTTVPGAPPAAPTLASPAGGATEVSTSPTLSWNASGGATSYRLQVSTMSNFSTTVYDMSGITGTSSVVTGLMNNTVYYWRVNASNAVGTSVYSNLRSFTTIAGGGAPAAPLLTSPANNATDQPTSVTLQWTRPASATSFRVQLGTDPNFVIGLRLDDSTVADTFRDVFALAENTTYHWRVNAKNAQGTSPFSPVWNFTTLCQSPAQVLLVFPPDQAIIAADSGRLIWQAQPQATRYWLELAIDPLFTFRTVDSTLTDTTVIARSLANNQPYYWKVRAGNTCGWGPFSGTRSFTVVVTTVGEARGVPNRFGLDQNYPNPFNPSTMIRYTLPTEGFVTLQVFDALGQLVKTLVEERKPAGYYEVMFDAGELGSGVYLYRIHAGAFVDAKKLMLLR